MRKSAVPHGFRILASQNYCGWKSYGFGPGFGCSSVWFWDPAVPGFWDIIMCLGYSNFSACFLG